MATISREFTVYGFCPVDNDDVPIRVEYISIPRPNENKRRKEFTKNSNRCYYLAESKCNLGKNCPVYQEAPVTRFEDFSKVYY